MKKIKKKMKMKTPPPSRLPRHRPQPHGAMEEGGAILEGGVGEGGEGTQGVGLGEGGTLTKPEVVLPRSHKIPRLTPLENIPD